MRELGVGINVLPPAIAVLADLGLLDALLVAGIGTFELRMTNRRGDVIWRELRGIAGGHRVPQVSIHRGRLQRVLAEAVADRIGDRSIRVGHCLSAFEQTRPRPERAGMARMLWRGATTWPAFPTGAA